MEIWEEIEQFTNNDETHRLLILASSNGAEFRYHALAWHAEDEEYVSMYCNGFWYLVALSKLFANAIECESAAKADPFWLTGIQ